MPPAPTNSGRVVAAAGRIRSCSPFVNAYGIAPYKERGSKLAGPACFTSLYGSLPFLCDNEKVVTTYLDKAIPLYLLMHLLQNWPVFLYREIADLPGNGFQIIDDGAHIRESRDRPCLSLLKNLEPSIFQFIHGIRQMPLWTNMADRCSEQLVKILVMIPAVDLLSEKQATRLEYAQYFSRQIRFMAINHELETLMFERKQKILSDFVNADTQRLQAFARNQNIGCISLRSAGIGGQGFEQGQKLAAAGAQIKQ